MIHSGLDLKTFVPARVSWIDVNFSRAKTLQRVEKPGAKNSAFVRLKSLRQWIQDDCKHSNSCTHVSYGFYHVRDNMGLGQLTKRKQLIEFLAK